MDSITSSMDKSSFPAMPAVTTLLLCLILVTPGFHAAVDPAHPGTASRQGWKGGPHSSSGDGCLLHEGALLPTLTAVASLLALSFRLPAHQLTLIELILGPTPPPPRA